MSELSLRFTSNEKDEQSPITVSVFWQQTGVSTNPVTFAPPLGDKELAELRWYLEEFSTWPTGPDYDRAERIEKELENWGRGLFRSVFSEMEAARIWQQFLMTPDDGKPENAKLLTIDAIDPRVLRLPWELIADEGGHIFTNRISVRRRMSKTIASLPKPMALPVRVVVVVARPDDVGFIDPRADTIPLLDALDQLGAAAEVEFLYPPTLAALSERLDAVADGLLPPVHVVHFDGHGVYDTSLGLGYLLFENDKHGSDRVDANRLGTLLNNSGVPLMVLTACQSAKQEERNPYASVAARLIRSGVGSVLAMNYSVLVAAARKFVGAFYAALVHGRSVGQAVDKARKALLADENRHTITRRNHDGDLEDVTVKLRDWFLPALYQQAADPVIFSPHPQPLSQRARGADSSPDLLPSPSGRGVGGEGFPEPPKHGFHGRAREMLKLERAFAEHHVIVLHGFGGLGKTALATEAGRWFTRTGRFPGGAAFISFESGGSLHQLCSWVGQAVSGDPDFMARDGDPVQRVAALLQERPALVILDNFESVLGRNPLMPPDEVKAVLDAVWLWSQPSPPTPLPKGEGSFSPPGRGQGWVSPRPLGEGSGVRAKTNILITTRDTNFNDARFAPSQRCKLMELGGLAERDALDLAAAVLSDYGLDRGAFSRKALVELMELLGGHPLSLYLALPQLRYYRPAELAARFEELLPGFSTGAAKERNESLLVSLEFSLRRLGEATRAALPALAVFEGGAMENVLLAITQFDKEMWQAARIELEQAALVSVESVPGVEPPFLRFHPTLLPYLATKLSSEQRNELEARYRELYYETSKALYQMDIQHPHEARAIAQREMPNLKRAFALMVAAAISTSLDDRDPFVERSRNEQERGSQAVDFAARLAQFLGNFGRWRERDALLAQVAGLQLGGAEGVTQAEFMRLNQQGQTLLQQGQAQAAEQIYRELLAKIEAGAAYDAAYDHAMTFFSLGRCLKAQGRQTQAIECQRRALQEFEPLSASDKSAKKMVGSIHTELAGLFGALGQFNEAEQEYNAALVIDKELDDRRGMGVDLGQLGTLAMLRNDLRGAQQRYTEALTTFRALNEPQSEAAIWHQLGMVAEEARDWEEAERCYRESLRLHESFNDLPRIAVTSNQLALVAKGAGRLTDAERWYLRTAEYAQYLPDQGAGVYNNLADLYLQQQRLDEAERYARRAVAIVEQHQIQTEVWVMYNSHYRE